MTRLAHIAVLAACIGPAASAQTVAVSGVAPYVADVTKTVPLPDGRSLVHSSSRATLLADDPASPLHQMSQDCYGIALLDAAGAFVQSGGSCTSIDGDGDGDLYHMSYVIEPESISWAVTGGTGRFAGATGGGTSHVAGVGLADRTTVRYEGAITFR